MNAPIRALAIAALLWTSLVSIGPTFAQQSEFDGIRRGRLTQDVISRGQLRRLLDQSPANSNPLRQQTPTSQTPPSHPTIIDPNVSGVVWQEDDSPQTDPSEPKPDLQTQEDKPPVMIGPMPSPEMLNRWAEMDMLVEIPVNKLLREIEERRSRIDTLVGIDQDSKNARLTFLEIAETAAEEANQNVIGKDQLQVLITTLNEDLQRLREKAKSNPEPATPDDSMSVEEMELLLRKFQNELTLQKTNLRKTQDRIQQRDDRIAAIPSERLEGRTRVNELHEELLQKQATGANDAEELLSIRALELAASTKVQLLEEEDHWLELSQEKLPLEKSIYQRSIQRLEQEINSWNDHLAKRKQVELERQIIAARQKALETHPALREFSLETTNLAQQRAELAEKIGKLNDEKSKVDKQSHDVEQHWNRLHGYEQSLLQGGNEESNNALIEVHRKLLRPWESMARIRTLESEIVLTQGAKQKLRDQQDQIADPASFIREHLKIEDDQPVADTTLVAMAEIAIENHRQQLLILEKDFEQVYRLLGEIKTSREGMLDQIAKTRELIDTYALWVQSAEPLDIHVLKKSQTGAIEFFDQEEWNRLGGSIVHHVKRRPWEPAVGMLGLFTAFLVGRRFKG